MNIVIMAGGGGTRLWPLSRQNNPKQFLDLGSGKTLIQHTYNRARAVAEPANIYVATTKEYQDRVLQMLPDIVVDNVFLEPTRRDTAPAFAAAAVQLKLKDKAQDPTIFMWSDHVFTAEQEFINDLKKLPDLIRDHPEAVIIIGHNATSPETTLGYLEVGEKVKGYDDVYQVRAFKEKPDFATAKKYVAAGNYFWNMAYISLRPAYLLEQLRQHAPELMAGIDQFEQALQTGKPALAAKLYGQLPKKSIDYALLEQAPDIIAITGDYGWNDVGGWAAVKDVFGTTGDHMPKGHHIHVDSNNNYIYNATNQAVSMIGLTDTIVVVTDDAILVTNKDDAHKVKEVVAKLEQEGITKLL